MIILLCFFALAPTPAEKTAFENDAVNLPVIISQRIKKTALIYLQSEYEEVEVRKEDFHRGEDSSLWKEVLWDAVFAQDDIRGIYKLRRFPTNYLYSTPSIDMFVPLNVVDMLCLVPLKHSSHHLNQCGWIKKEEYEEAW